MKEMTEEMKVLIAFAMLENPDLDEVSAEFAITEVIREEGLGSVRITIENAKDFLGALRRRVAAA